MKRLTQRVIMPFLFVFCLMAALCACDVPPESEAPVSSAAAPTTQKTQPEQTVSRLELDGAAELPVRDFSGVSYVELRSLCEAWSLKYSEENGTLRLELEGGILTLADGSDEARTEEDGRIALGAPVLWFSEGWYLPVSALEAVWGRMLVEDQSTELLRCLRVEDGPAVYWNGAEAGSARRCNGVPVLTAGWFTAVSTGRAETGADPDGTPTLTLWAWGHTAAFRQGSLRAELDGVPTALPVPAWQAGEDWYLPAGIAAEALGCVGLEEHFADRLNLLRTREGPVCWFSGLCLGASLRVDDALYGGLPALARAMGGTLTERDGSLTLKTPGHRLVLWPGETRVEADGIERSLPLPVIPADGSWPVPLDAMAELLGLPGRTEDEIGAVYSALTPCETELWIDGVRTQAYTDHGTGPYVRLGDVLEITGGSFVPIENEAVLQARNREIDLWGGEARYTLDGETLPLAAPAAANGADWYLPAADLLPALGLPELVDPELDRRYYTRIVKNDQLPTGCRVPIFMYHAVSDQIWGIRELFVSPAELEAQIQAILEAGYTPITFEDLDHVDEIDKPVMLTFDDGYDDNYTELFPLLKKYNVKATVFVIVNDIGTRHKLTEEQIREMSDSGLVSIQSHTMSHEYLDGMYEKQLRYEHYDSMLALTRLTCKQPFVLCYPTGKNTAYSRSITAEYYEFGLNMTGPCYVTGAEPYKIYRYYISRSTSVQTLLSYLKG